MIFKPEAILQNLYEKLVISILEYYICQQYWSLLKLYLLQNIIQYDELLLD